MSRRPLLLAFLRPSSRPLVPRRSLAVRPAPSTLRAVRSGPSTSVDLSSLLPFSHISALHKARIVPFGLRECLELLTYYNASIIRHQPSASITQDLLQKFSITSDDLYNMALALRTAPDIPPAVDLVRMKFVRHMLANASSAGCHRASVRLHRLLIGAKDTARKTGAAVSPFLERETTVVWERIVGAAEEGEPTCLFEVGCASSGKKAKACFSRAGEAGFSGSWAKLGLLLRDEGDIEGAKQAWRRGTVRGDLAEDEMCYYYLATVTPNTEPDFERLALTAAIGGVVQAQHLLGVYYEHIKKPQNPANLLLAEDWYKCAAMMGVGNSFVALLKLFRKQGRQKEADEWKEKALEMGPNILGLDPMAVL